jgi:hypothetical protein
MARGSRGRGAIPAVPTKRPAPAGQRAGNPPATPHGPGQAHGHGIPAVPRSGRPGRR